MAASRRLRDLQSQPGNKICVDCSQKNPQWASVSYGIFMGLECLFAEKLDFEDPYYVKEGGYDYKVNETVNVVAAKTTEIGQRTWGIMRGVMAMATQKVEELSKDGWKADNWQQNESEGNGYYQEFNKQENKGWNSSSAGGQSSSSGNYNSYSSSSWDDWDQKDVRKEDSTKSTGTRSNDGWAGWDDGKDDGFDDNFYQREPDKKAVGPNGKSDDTWTGGGFL
ncbi:hypothetical protein JCGZ_09044 [Jatropha curcas]|uniref:Arf-GAP domain-containing protein n=1 Tax=Jatropha curcas TaxID=180498 RepID=A0A067KH94_JATCU|nr:hypothetical protein JCGZ_09044 [Jatropha curcas]